MRNLFVAALVLGLLSATSLMAQHSDQGDRGERGERIEKIIEIVGGPGGEPSSFDCETAFDHTGRRNDFGSFGHGPKPGQGPDHIMMMTHLLDLTAEQQAQLKKMRLEFELQLVDAHAALKKARIKLKALMQEDDSKESKVFSAIDKVSDREADVKKMKYANKQKMHSILTKEQLEKAKKMHSGAGNSEVFEWRSDGSHGDKKIMEFHGEGKTDDEGNVFIIKKSHK